MLNANCHVFRLDHLLILYLNDVLLDALESVTFIEQKSFLVKVANTNILLQNLMHFRPRLRY